ncbi:ABC transporter ATP-binding protein [Acetobacteraceae bacterium]|nr:ABC transporter ATP-binding protein [Acetobacteraceae bacterium]
MKKIFATNSLEVKVGKKTLLSSVDIKPVKEGHIVALLGPNGAGKSTLLRAIAGLMKISSGEVCLGQKNITCLPMVERSKKTIYCPQILPPAVRLQVLEALMVACQAGRSSYSREKAIDESLEVLKRLKIENLASRYLNELSGGQRQLVGIAQTLVRKTEVLLLDEPLSALDMRHQIQVMDLIKEETLNRSLITFLVVHDLNIALRYADDAIYLKKGTVIAQGPVCAVTTSEVLAEAYGIKACLGFDRFGKTQLEIEGLCE